MSKAGISMNLKRKQKRGFTLLEITIVVGIIGVLTGLAVWQSRDFVPRLKTRAAALEFAKHIDLLRMLALRTNSESRLCLLDYDSAPSNISSAAAGKYSLQLGNKSLNSDDWDYLPDDFYDNSNDDQQGLGTIDMSPSGKQYRKYVSLADWGSSIGGPDVGNSSCIVFSPRGYVRNPASDFNSQGFLEVTFVNKFARNEGESLDYIVMIARTGMTRIDISLSRLNENYFSGTGYDASES